MELTVLTEAKEVETQWPLPLLLSMCVEADRGRWLTVADGDDGGVDGDSGGDAVATAAAVVCVC